jgi:ABC-2 type transport system permease protein
VTPAPSGLSPIGRLGAIARRDFIITWSYPMQLLTRYGQIAFVTVLISFVARLVNSPPALARYGGRYFDFALSGLIVVGFVTLGLGALTTVVTAEQAAGTFEVLLTSPTPLPVLLAGIYLVPAALTVVDALTYVAVGWLLGAHISLSGLAAALPVLFLTAAAFVAAGVTSAGFVVLTKRGDPVTLVLTQVATLLAGALFPIHLLPGPLQAVVRIVPAYWGLEAVRAILLLHRSLWSQGRAVLVLVAFTAALFPLALVVFRRALRVARVTGTLGNS